MKKPTDWKAIVEATNAKTYVLPTGWISKADLAVQLGCSDDRVRFYMAPAIKDGSVEYGTFKVWDSKMKRLTSVAAYRSLAKE